MYVQCVCTMCITMYPGYIYVYDNYEALLISLQNSKSRHNLDFLLRCQIDALTSIKDTKDICTHSVYVLQQYKLSLFIMII